MQHVSTDI